MKTTIENLIFPCEIKKKLKIKGSFGNLDIQYIDGHLIKFDKTNLSVTEPHKIIISNESICLILISYDDDNNLYLKDSHEIITLSRLSNLVLKMQEIKTFKSYFFFIL